MSYVKQGWVNIKNNLSKVEATYSKEEIRKILLNNDYYKTLFGRSKNRTLISQNPELYNSIYKHTQPLETIMKKYNRYFGRKSFKGKTHTSKTKQQQRKSTLKYLEKTRGQLMPRYNVNSIHIIEEYGKQHGYNSQHAENGGEYHIKEQKI